MLGRELPQLVRHMEWADAQVWSAALALGGGRSDPRLRELLHHVHIVQWSYLQIWRGERAETPEADSFGDLDALHAWCRRFYEELSASSEVLAPDRLDEEVQFPWAERIAERFGAVQPVSRLESLHQVLSHSTYHRGQVNARLRELGREPPLVDFIAWLWSGRPVATWPE